MTLVVAMGGTGTGSGKSEVSRICAQLDDDVAAWRSRPWDKQAFPMCSWTRPTARSRRRPTPWAGETA